MVAGLVGLIAAAAVSQQASGESAAPTPQAQALQYLRLQQRMQAESQESPAAGAVLKSSTTR